MMKKLFPFLLLLVFLGAGCQTNTKSSGANDGGVIKSINSGKDWVATAAVPTAKGIGTLSTTNVVQLTMDPSDKNVLYASTREDGFLYSEDAGATWRQPRFAELTKGLVYDVAVDPQNVCTVYVAKGPRLYKTSDCMRTFDSEVYVEARADVSVMKVAVDWFDTRNVWIGLTNGDVLKSQDAGKTWTTLLRAGNEVSDILINNTDSRQVLVSLYNGGIQKSVDGGTTWTDLSPELKKWTGAKQVFDLTQSKNGGAVLAATQFGLLRSNDFGTSFENLKLVTSGGQVQIRAVAFDPNNADTMYYATVGTFYKSMDGGTSWKTEKIASSRVPRAILVDPKDGGVVYIGLAKAVN